MTEYAIFVKTGAEDVVEKYLDYHFKGTECYAVIPKTKLTEKTKGNYYKVFKPLFPGYVFINIDMSAGLYYIIKQIPKVYRFVNQADKFYSQIYEDEMEPILSLIDENNIIDCSKIYIENSKVYVKSGPLKGMEGLIQKVDKRKGRAKVIIHLLGSPRVVDLGVEIIDLLP